MHNLYEQFRQLIPEPPLQAGTVVGVGSGVVTVALPGGGLIRARAALPSARRYSCVMTSSKAAHPP